MRANSSFDSFFKISHDKNKNTKTNKERDKEKGREQPKTKSNSDYASEKKRSPDRGISLIHKQSLNSRYLGEINA